jgi:hypothetical protein
MVFVLPLLGSLLGGLILVGTLGSAQGAPQEAAGAAFACAAALLPYVFARSVEKMGSSRRRHQDTGLHVDGVPPPAP